MLRPNLSVKILLAVGLTTAAVIAIYTYFVIRVQSAWWYDRTQAQNLIAATMVHEYIKGVMLSERHEEVDQFLAELKKTREIQRGRIVKLDGTVAFSTETQEVARMVVDLPPELFTGKRTLQGVRSVEGQEMAITMRPVIQMASCRRCHDPKQEVLGAIVLERSMAPALASIASNRNLLIVYGLVIFALVGAVLWLLIVRFVTQPVRDLLGQMHRVRQGDLAARAEIAGSDEIGKLALGFNEMVQSLATAQHQLHESHEKQIQQAGKLASIGELASGIAHEIRNPLAGIGAAVEVLAESGSGDGKYGEVAGEIHQQIARLNRTLRDLLDFARPREPEIEPCDVHDILRAMLALVRPDAQKHHIRIVEEFAADLPPISADSQQLQQAILNILLNATQAMPDGGTLTARTERVDAPRNGAENATKRGPYVRINIRDTGVGISREHLGSIFSPFYTTKHRGTGLGLSITRTIVEKHHGTIAVESELNRGTTFTLEFAAAEEGRAGFSSKEMQVEEIPQAAPGGKEIVEHAAK